MINKDNLFWGSIGDETEKEQGFHMSLEIRISKK